MPSIPLLGLDLSLSFSLYISNCLESAGGFLATGGPMAFSQVSGKCGTSTQLL